MPSPIPPCPLGLAFESSGLGTGAGVCLNPPTFGGRQVHRRAGVVVALVHVDAGLEEHLQQGQIAVRGGIAQKLGGEFVVHGAAASHQVPRHDGKAIADGVLKRRGAPTVLDVDIGLRVMGQGLLDCRRHGGYDKHDQSHYHYHYHDGVCCDCDYGHYCKSYYDYHYDVAITITDAHTSTSTTTTTTTTTSTTTTTARTKRSNK